MTRRELLAIAAAAKLAAQEEFEVSRERPRLLLTRQRLRLLRRERERKSERWLHFETLMAGKAAMPEPGFAQALYHQVTGLEEAGREAIRSAGTATADARQVALVYDWCNTLLSPGEEQALRSKLARFATAAVPPGALAAARDRAFGAIAIGDGKALGAVVEQWWRKEFAPSLVNGSRLISAAEGYALLELLHGVRDNVLVDLRENATSFFEHFASGRVLSYYPARYPAPENEYRIPYFTGKGDPDLKGAALSRAADLSLIAYDNNATEHQFLQGWVSHDSFQLKSSYGTPYEFLWANPYQPGLSYHHLPLKLHEAKSGRLFVRSDWKEEATWAGYADGRLQIFQDGRIQTGAAGSAEKPLILGESALVAGKPQMKWQLRPEDPGDWFIVGLKPNTTYDVEVDDEELAEAVCDRGGILALELTRRDGVGVRLRERTAPTAGTSAFSAPDSRKAPGH